jgi:hypothetical protein
MANVELLFRAFFLEPSSDRARLRGQIELALGLLNGELGLTFEHDGAESADGVTYTVWTDDARGTTETSWVRLTDDERAGSLALEINATTPAILERASALFLAHTPVARVVERAVRPFGG